ncbi:adenosylhomocysteine nucleosidase [Thermosipho melanesiensis]|uniref:Adenosylhomocysteine nucleosidase n=2 Tax=Thermosipho melanesiensis TaxID=46541 RepID=A6LKA1_THEM4|nr:5'-methylthioadenosine/S-adenosylhomocysteine nucleosidase [Thermosipho melanesiensis]ABR30352.1 Adenosylhomocysteine nucleosidase [Thermosipho melanesiensis BI429]APT73518.1 adenosylhomocysteine nucleosidase [Thermosipho melanesiensis]OOC37468.1 adenosylhomocysteine nucleosidase [Thermosipho melanesiensis]OOC39673.1 adenosylhomocysteine nucleosidase [Thermosipho melanesiensis]OOC39701.1 adenosylhomocysteine nucleosidase [Thermosipho melanesiensis]
MIVITSVLRDEILGAFRELLPVLENGEILKRPYVRGLIGVNEVLLVYGLIGKVESAMMAQALIDRFKPKYFIHCGSAGAINKERKIGDIVCGTEYIEHDISFREKNVRIFKASDVLMERIYDIFNDIKFGVIASGDVFVDSEEEKERIYRETNAEVVDMDSAAIAKVCAENDINFCALKIVVDSSMEGSEIEIKRNLKRLAPFPSAIIAEMLEKHLL